jgi:hypothetical protein
MAKAVQSHLTKWRVSYSPPCGQGNMKTSDCCGSYPSPLWGGWLAQILNLGQSGGGSHNGSRARGTPTPASAFGRCCASPPLGRPSPQGGGIATFVTFQPTKVARGTLQFVHMRWPSPGRRAAGGALHVTTRRRAARSGQCRRKPSAGAPSRPSPTYAAPAPGVRRARSGNRGRAACRGPQVRSPASRRHRRHRRATPA